MKITAISKLRSNQRIINVKGLKRIGTGNLFLSEDSLLINLIGGGGVLECTSPLYSGKGYVKWIMSI